MTRLEKRWARVLFDAMVPPYTHAQVPDGAGTLGADAALDALYRHASFLGALVYRVGLWLCWFLPLFVVGRLRTFGGLSGPEQDGYLRTLYRSRFYLIRQLVFLLKLAACTGYFTHPQVRAAFGVDGGPAHAGTLPLVNAPSGTEPAPASSKAK